MGRHGGRYKQLFDDLKKRKGYWKLKEEALCCTQWSTYLGRGCGPLARRSAERKWIQNSNTGCGQNAEDSNAEANYRVRVGLAKSVKSSRIFWVISDVPGQHIEVPRKNKSNLNHWLHFHVQGVSNMTGTNCDLFTHKSSRSYLNHLVLRYSWQMCLAD
jgi:hypothetical protein